MTFITTGHELPYDLTKLWKLTERRPTVCIEVKYLVDGLEDLRWENDLGQAISPKMVLEDPNISPRDMSDINAANLGAPILVYCCQHPIYDVVDGLHKLAKAVKMKRNVVYVRYVSIDQLQQCEKHLKTQ
jgi:hypothetical protein